MKQNHLPAQRPVHRPSPAKAALALLGLLATLLGPAALHAAGSPAEPVPSSRWGNPERMRPWEIVGDSTHYDGKAVPGSATPVWFSTALSGKYLFTATGKGVMIHDLDDNPKDPRMVGYTYMSGNIPAYFQSDLKFYIYEVAAVEGWPEVFVSAGEGHGALIWDFSQRGNPRILVQDYQHGSSSSSAYATTLGTGHFAFFAVGGNGVSVYDLDRAQQHSFCNTQTGPCTDVFRRYISTSAASTAVHGVGNYLAVATGRSGIELWNVANPANPSRIGGGVTSGANLSDVVMWQSGSRYYAAATDATRRGTDYKTYIYDVTCVTSGSCSASALSNPVATLPSNDKYVSQLSISQSEGRSYLYVGDLSRFESGDQREFLWDVTDPHTMSTAINGPDELTPDNAAGQGYWGWYYARNPTGFQNMAPMEAVVRNGYVYRAAWTILDVHELLGAAPPAANFDWSPKPVYQGQSVTFTDQSGGAPSQWDWSFSGANPTTGSATAKNPIVTFNGVGTANVSLSAANDAGFGNPVTKQVPVLDPKPTVGNATASPSSALICQQIAFEAKNVTGRAPLSYSWTIKKGADTVKTGSGNPFTWSTGQATNPGSDYTAQVTVANGTVDATKTVGFSLATPPQLAIQSAGNDAFSFGTVQFRAQTAGAAKWTWNFGDGTGDHVFTQQSAGENPIHNFTQTGTYDVTLTVENCIHGTVEQSFQVTILNIDPLEIAEFEADSQCQFGSSVGGGCFQVNVPVNFAQSISGSPESIQYDWDGNGTWDQTSASPVNSHTYGQGGTFTPKVRVTRGPETIVVANGCNSGQTGCAGTPITVGAATPPSLSISGASSGSTGQNLTFTASASNCNPVASGWNWTASGGGSVNGSGSQVTISWGTAGSKIVSVTNSACSGATGTKSVNIGGNDPPPPPPPNGKPTASFTYSPSSPTTGQAVSFDGSSSTGNPTSYAWDFADGSTAIGSKVNHTFSSPGSYQVTLVVSKPGNCGSQVGGAGICSDEEKKTVLVKSGNAVSASFDDDVECGGGQVGGAICTVGTGEQVSFSDTSTGEVSQRTWDFGDGTTAGGKNVKHAWNAPGSYTVKLTVENDDDSSTTTKVYTVTGERIQQLRAVVVPWIARADADKALPQSSDLDIHNPGSEALKVNLIFRRRGLPEPDPPQVERTVAPGATLHVPDAMTDLFGRPNQSGFLFVEPMEGDAQPVVTSTNHTFREDGESFGQVVPGVPIDVATKAEGAAVSHLVGLNANSERLAYFGISNPNDAPFFYKLKFYDSLGRLIAQTDEPSGIARFGQKQYQEEEELADIFGIANLDDYRIEVVPEPGSPTPLVYGANLRRASFDPSFVRPGRTDTSVVYLVGTLNTPGLNDSFFRSDVVLGNTAGETVVCDLAFQGSGAVTNLTDPITETLQPGESLRLVDAVAEWDVGNTVGAMKVACEAPAGVFPVVQGESYDTSNPGVYYGQFMPALTEDDAANAGESHTLVGLRKDADHRTTIWLFNPSEDVVAEFNLRYFDANGNQVGSENGIRLGRGKFRQLNPEFHPLPETMPGGFVVRIEVTEGKLLTAGQVVNKTNDPAYIVGK